MVEVAFLFQFIAEECFNTLKKFLLAEFVLDVALSNINGKVPLVRGYNAEIALLMLNRLLPILIWFRVRAIKVTLRHLINILKLGRLTQIVQLGHCLLHLCDELLLMLISLHRQYLLLEFDVFAHSSFQILQIFVVIH